jgi:methanogenic corrinoid protein MtbC1
MFLEAAGFEIHNLGRDVPTDLFLDKARELNPDIIGLSAMMSTTALKLKDVLEDFERSGLKDGIYFVVGGAAISEEFAKDIGANAYASDAKKAAQVFEELLRRGR